MKEIMINQFVPYDLAIKLREKGFDELCMAFYNTEDFYNHKGLHKPGEWFNITSTPLKDYNKQSFVIVPLWQQVIDWLEGKGLWITITPPFEDLKFEYTICQLTKTSKLSKKLHEGFDFNTKYEARQAAIKQALTLK